MLARSPDRVALTGALVALVSVLSLPVVHLRPNRLALGDPYGWLDASGAFVLPAAVCVAVFAIAFLASSRTRGHLLSAAGCALLLSVAWATGAASSAMLEHASAIARVSIGSGVWLAWAGALIVVFAGWQALGDGRVRDGRASRRLRGLYPAASVLGVVAIIARGGLDTISLATEYAVRSSVFWPNAAAHLRLVGVSLGIGMVIGIPLGILASRNKHVRRAALGVTGVIQTIPSLAMLGLLIAPLAALSSAYPVLREMGVRGIGETPALIALTLYALLPIVRNTYVGLAEVDRGAVDAGLGMGMSRRQLLWRVELPLAMPLVFEGVRASAVLLVGITAVTALVGARNLGSFIFEGLGQAAPDLILLGALPIILLAVAADLVLTGLAAAVIPKGVRAL